ncbi:MAG: hypothetical protein K8F29_00800 [Kofleriaceae bacterium]|nr:hypothetical protein [Candidatus Methylomirabilis lanthanidiphila]
MIVLDAGFRRYDDFCALTFAIKYQPSQDEAWEPLAVEGQQIACSNPWYDVDTPDDLNSLRLSLDLLDAGQAEHTRRFLMEQIW